MAKVAVKKEAAVVAQRQNIASAMRHPRLLLNVPSTFEYVKMGGQHPASVEVDMSQEKKSRVYHIKIFQQVAEMIYVQHPFKNTGYKFSDFVIGLLAHEIAHVMAGAFDVRHPYENDIYKEIYNIITDSHDEYWMQRMHPVYAPYINATLLGAQYASAVRGQVRDDLTTLYHMVRFGYIPPKSDEAFCEFLLPVIKAAVRGNRKDVVDATVAIYEYLRAVHEYSPENGDEWQRGMKNGSLKTIPLTKEQLDKLQAQGVQVAQTDTLDALKDTLEGGKLPGVGEHPITVTEESDDFYLSVVINNAVAIATLRKFFLQKYNKSTSFRAFEGELLLTAQAQQQAYIDEILGENSRVYTIVKKKLLDMKIITYRDISSSTKSIQQAFAEATVIVHAAVDGISGIKTAHLDFGNSGALSFGFDESVAKAKIRPQSYGNTYLLPAIRLAEQLDLRSKQLLQFVFTDGAIDNPIACEEAFAAMGGVAWFVEIIPPGGKSEGYVSQFKNNFSCTLEDLPYEMFTRL